MTSGSPPVLYISLSDHSFSALASSFACSLAHSRPLWRFMFFSKRAFNALSSSSRCSGDKSFLSLLMFPALVALICCSHSRLFPRFLSVTPLRSATWVVFRLVFAFLSIRSFHAVRSAPVSTSSLAAARRICVCPIFPQPPGIGRKISGASSTNAACCSSASIRFPYPLLARPAKQISRLLHEKPAILRGSTLPPPPGPVQSCESLLRSSGDSVDYGVSDHHR